MNNYAASKPDPLSDMVALLKPRAVAYRVFSAHDGWSVRFPASELVVFGQLISGRCVIKRGDGPIVELVAGDFLLMGAPASWVAGSSLGLPPVAFEDVIADPGRLLSQDPDPVITRFMAGAFMFAMPNADLLSELFRPMMHIRGADIEAGHLRGLLAQLGDEALATRPGRSLILDRLLEIILVEAIRHRPADEHVSAGVLAGIADPQIGGALRMMHDDVRRPWTVGGLARGVGMSRSSFAARFMGVLGLPPMAYLLRWRLTVAKAALSSSRRPMVEVADLAGYQSVSAFSTAFSKATGSSPTAFRNASALRGSYGSAAGVQAGNR